MSERKLKKDSELNRQLMNSMSRTKKLYQLVAVIIATAFVSSAVTLTISADGPTGFGTIIEPGSQVSETSYIMFRDEATVYARNGMTGEVEFSGTDHAAVIRSVIDALPDIGGRIFFKNGVYELDSCVEDPNDLGTYYVIGVMNPSEHFRVVLEGEQRGIGKSDGAQFLATLQFEQIRRISEGVVLSLNNTYVLVLIYHILQSLVQTV